MRKELRSAGNMLNVSMEPNPTGGGRVFDRNSKGKLVDTSLANPDVLRLELEGVLAALGAPTFWGFGFAIAVAGSELAEMRAPAPAAG
jgi:hypothetical protein